jgi:hypothetical protein
VTGRLFSPGTLVSSTNKTDRNNITEILLKVAYQCLFVHSLHSEGYPKFHFANVMQVVLELGICTRLFRIGMGFMVFIPLPGPCSAPYPPPDRTMVDPGCSVISLLCNSIFSPFNVEP